MLQSDLHRNKLHVHENAFESVIFLRPNRHIASHVYVYVHTYKIVTDHRSKLGVVKCTLQVYFECYIE